MNESKIVSLFPTPLYVSKVDLTQEELEFCNGEHQYIKNEGNFSSNDTYILNNVKLKSLKEKLQKHLTKYFNDIIQTDSRINPYITQSWINFTKENGHHHPHTHANSIVAAVLYIETAEGDCIKFHTSTYNSFYFKPKELNNFNCKDVTVGIKKGDLLLFPASLIHSVPERENKGNRLSLSFNSFFEGTAGELHDLTELRVPIKHEDYR